MEPGEHRAITDMKNGLFHLPLSGLGARVLVPHCSATMHTINVNVICIFSGAPTPGIFLIKSVRFKVAYIS